MPKNKKKTKNKPQQTLSVLFNNTYKGTFDESISKHDLQKTTLEMNENQGSSAEFKHFR